MKKIFITISLMLLVYPVLTTNAWAHPGRTDSNGGHTCRTNCEKWGYKTGEYHYHNGGSSGSSNGSVSGSTKEPNVKVAPAAPPKPTYSPADVEEGKTSGQSRGYEDGYNRNASNSVTGTGNEGYQKGYVVGYEAGYHEGLQKIKEEDITAGKSAGESDGKSAFQEGESQDVVNNDSKSVDWNNAYKGAFIISFNYEKSVQDAEKSGHDLGYSLAKLAVPAEFSTDETIKQKFEAAYQTGYEKRMKEEETNHLELGKKDGYALSALAIDSIDDKFVAFYEKGYEEGKSNRKEEVLAEGFQSAFMNMEYKEKEEYDNPEVMEWYKEGFDSNEIASKIKVTAFDNGYSNSKYMIPKEFKVNDDAIELYDSLFEKGQELRKEETQKYAIIATGIAIPAVGLAIGGYFLRKRKKKRAV